MKLLSLILCSILCFTIADAQESFGVSNGITTNVYQSARARLELSTSVSEQRYSVESGSRQVHLTLNLTYSNIGKRSILLDKKSSLIYRKLLSSSLKAASKSKYEYDESSSFVSTRSMQAGGIRLEESPEREAFILLKSVESFSLKKELVLRLYDGTKNTEDFLHPGTYFLQISVATWYYFADPDEYRAKWNAGGYLWSQNITSVPMSLTIAKGQ